MEQVIFVFRCNFILFFFFFSFRSKGFSILCFDLFFFLRLLSAVAVEMFQPLDLSLSRKEKSISSYDSDTGLSDVDIFAEKFSGGGVKFYSPASIMRVAEAIEKEMKEAYVEAVDLPYLNKKMAREFKKKADDTIEKRERKDAQARKVRLSRDRIKFMRERITEENRTLNQVLDEHIKRLVNLECYANERLMINGQPPIDWRNAWLDDASCGGDSDGNDDVVGKRTEDISGREGGECADIVRMDDQMIENDRRVIDSDEAMSVNDGATIYESHADGHLHICSDNKVG